MKLSIIVSIYNSHEIVRRQCLYLSKMNLPNDIEVIFIDDGSSPPLSYNDYKFNKFSLYATNNKLAWTQGAGRNLGALKAKGEYLLMTDIDHILSREAIDDSYALRGDKMIFRRQYGVLLEDGTLTQDIEVLKDYGYIPSRKNLDCSVHGNTFAIKRSTFNKLGGYSKKSTSQGYHPISKKGDDCLFNSKWNHYAFENNITLKEGRHIYMFPIGRYHINGELNPKGLFHNLSQTKQEKFYKE